MPKTAAAAVKVQAHTAAQVAATSTALAAVPIGGRGPKTGYNRTEKFGRAWVDVDDNSCDTRDDVLTRDLTGVGKRNACVVTSGVLRDPYTSQAISYSKADAAAIQIDHVVPLSLAWQLGAGQWPQGKRVTFANDPANLLAVDGPANNAKSDSGPDSWLPPNKAYRCTYVMRFTRVVSLYALRLTPSMAAAIKGQLDRCVVVSGDPATLTPLPVSDWPRAAAIGGHPAPRTAAPATTPGSPAAPGPTTGAAPGAVYYANCSAVRAAGKAPLHRGQPGYRAALDRDGDGTACE